MPVLSFNVQRLTINSVLAGAAAGFFARMAALVSVIVAEITASGGNR
jgi:hypothetical protein